MRLYWRAVRWLHQRMAESEARAVRKAAKARSERMRRQAAEYCDHGYPWLLCPYGHAKEYRR